jgi:hypothetical protein
VVALGSFQFDPSLFLDALEGSDWNFPFRMRHRHPAFFVGCMNCLWRPT